MSDPLQDPAILAENLLEDRADLEGQIGGGYLARITAAAALLVRQQRKMNSLRYHAERLLHAHHHGNGLQTWHDLVDRLERAIEQSSDLTQARDEAERLQIDCDALKREWDKQHERAEKAEAERDEALAREANANRMSASGYSAGFAAGVNAAVATYEAAMGGDAHVYGIDRMLDVLAAVTPAPQPEGDTGPSVVCNKCGWEGDEDGLIATLDAEDGEPCRACPDCRTDANLMDVPAQPSAATQPAQEAVPDFATSRAEGQIMDGWVDDKTFIEPLTPATPTAQTPVAWAESYDGGISFTTLSLHPTQHHTFPLFRHPPQPSVSVAQEALKLAAARLQRLALEIPSTTSLRAEAFEWAEAALRALKGGSNDE